MSHEKHMCPGDGVTVMARGLANGSDA
jgi:hypothetical protein